MIINSVKMRGKRYLSLFTVKIVTIMVRLFYIYTFFFNKLIIVVIITVNLINVHNILLTVNKIFKQSLEQIILTLFFRLRYCIICLYHISSFYLQLGS